MKDSTAQKAQISVGVVLFRSDFVQFQGLVETLVRELKSLLPPGGHAQLSMVSNDGDQTFLDFVTAHLAETDQGGQVQFEALIGQGNIGYGAGNNLAIRNAHSEYHLIVNPDVELETGSLANALEFLDNNPRCVLIAPQAFGENGTYQRLAKRSPSIAVLALRALSIQPSPSIPGRRVARYVYADRLPSEHPEEIELASGCFMVCRTEALVRIGGFDEAYFLYFEDYDLSHRLSHQGALVELPNCQIKHFGGWATKRELRRLLHFLRSAIRYFWTYR